MAYISSKKWDKIIYEIYKGWYSKCSPKADYDELVATAYPCREKSDLPGEGPTKKIVFEAYFISSEEMDQVVTDVMKKYKVPKHYRKDLAWLWLGHGPFTFFDEASEPALKALLDKVDRGELITPADVSSGRELSTRDILRLYEWNRHSHPEESQKYFNMLKNRK